MFINDLSVQHMISCNLAYKIRSRPTFLPFSFSVTIGEKKTQFPLHADFNDFKYVPSTNTLM